MPILQQSPKNMVVCRGIVVWDGITRPEALEAKEGKAPGMKWNLKVVLEPNNPDLPVLDQLAQRELFEGEFKGVLPRGGNMPIGTVGPGEFKDLFPGCAVINVSTFRQPQVIGENGNALQPHEYGPLFYNGQRVDVILHCSTYNNVSKGVATRLDAVRVLTSENAPRIDIGGGGTFDTTSVWGGQQQNAAPAQGQGQPAWGQQPQQNAAPAQGQGQPAWGQQPQQNAAPAQGQGQPAWGQQPQQAAPAQGQGQPAWGQQPQQAAPQQAAPAWGQQPQQAAPAQGQGQPAWGQQPQQAAPQQAAPAWGQQPQQAAPQQAAPAWGQQPQQAAPQQNATWMPQQ
jgi:hypothetical protein